MADEQWQSLAKIRALVDLGRHQEARTALGTYLAGTPDSVEALCLLGLCELELGAQGAALRAANQAIAVAPEFDWAHRLRALALKRQGDYDDARLAAEEAVRLDPNDYSNHHTLAAVLLALAERAPMMAPREMMAARAAALRAVELAPHEPSAHIIAGLTAGALQLTDAEQASYHEALRLDPDNAIAMNNLAAMDMQSFRLGRAAQRVVAGLQLDPHEEILRRNLDMVVVRLMVRLFNVMLLTGFLMFLTIGQTGGTWGPRALVGAALISGYALVAWLTLRHLPPGARRYARGLPRRMNWPQRFLLAGLVIFTLGLLVTAFAPVSLVGLGSGAMMVVLRIAQVILIITVIGFVANGVRNIFRSSP